ncbi:flagellar L-ring protein [Iodidimonas muriae]|uniref:Flagellar L-ring protein n=1 Tax=Iodidimonas muriae TaxID=261467 RepID=A0ABQ2L920_9PROT|nr:flagellar basal body L-ring protein FlgH [Iodidimonas muriae]GER08124.1 flagellar L-ring protein [Kordiimonadales bacterium JCM 17843]GGO06152.1 flagellar L-ring protein [Iodidimonas muriae]
MNSPLSTLRTIGGLVALSTALSACTVGDRLANIGKAPDLAPIENVQAPAKQRSISLPQPAQTAHVGQANSLWRTGAKAFFRDQRAGQIGDILTVAIEINDRAEIENETIRSRNNGETAGLDGFLGFEGKLDKVLPNTVNPAALADFGSTSTSTGSGEVDRSEDISLTIAAIVVDVLPNGNLVIQGRQEVRVNFEVRELLIAGIVRPEDISSGNTINHSQIAEARISYGGRGQLTDVQQPRYGQQLYDILFPF